jgi:hypothetical protein
MKTKVSNPKYFLDLEVKATMCHTIKIKLISQVDFLMVMFLSLAPSLKRLVSKTNAVPIAEKENHFGVGDNT